MEIATVGGMSPQSLRRFVKAGGKLEHVTAFMRPSKYLGENIDGSLMLGDGKVIGSYKVRQEWRAPGNSQVIIQLVDGWVEGVKYVARGEKGNALFNGRIYRVRTDNRLPQREGVG